MESKDLESKDLESKNLESKDLESKELESKKYKYYQKYIHDIKNMTIFSEEDIHKINNLSSEERLLILLEYNTMMKSMTFILENM